MREKCADGKQRHVGAEPVEHRLAVREQAGVTEQKVEADRSDSDD